MRPDTKFASTIGRGHPLFEECRKAVARELKWPVDQVLDWEVRSFMTIRPEKLERIMRRLTGESP